MESWGRWMWPGPDWACWLWGWPLSEPYLWGDWTELEWEWLSGPHCCLESDWVQSWNASDVPDQLSVHLFHPVGKSTRINTRTLCLIQFTYEVLEQSMIYIYLGQVLWDGYYQIQIKMSLSICIKVIHFFSNYIALSDLTMLLKKESYIIRVDDRNSLNAPSL